MKKRFLLTIILVVLLSIYIVREKTVMFVYTNPYIETASFSHIARAVKYLDKTLNFVKNDAKALGVNFDYLYINTYGSGFLKNNPIPNDLDTAVGIYLGEYDYDGKNGKEIATSLIDKITAFQYVFSTYISTLDTEEAYVADNPFMLLEKFKEVKNLNTEEISNAFKNVMAGKDYIVNSVPSDIEDKGVLRPYVMKPDEVLLKNYVMIHMLSDMVCYNEMMPKYLREITVIPEFYFDLRSGDNVKTVEIVPEIALGKRVQLARNFFTSSVYVNNSSAAFISKRPYLTDDDKYFSYRILTLKTYLQDISEPGFINDKPIKYFKRVMQITDMISPIVEDKVYNEISEIVYENLSNREIQLLNEYLYCCEVLKRAVRSYKLYSELRENGELDKILNVISNVNAELEQRGVVDKNTLKVLKDYSEKELANLTVFENDKELFIYKNVAFFEKYEQMQKTINSAVVKQMKNNDKLAKNIKMFKKISDDESIQKQLYDTMIEDKKNFNIKRKLIFIY